MHRVIASRLSLDPRLLATARARVEQWLATGTVHREYAEAWAALLAGPLETIVAALADPAPHMRALRQASPFAGALAPRERWRIHRELAGANG